MSNLISIKNIKKSFGDHEVLKDISLYISKGEIISIIGSSGSGKSTLLRCINLLEKPDQGEIYFEGNDVIHSKVNLIKLRSEIGMVFQSFNLFENMNVLKNCMVGQIKVLHKNKLEAKETALKYLKLVGMDAYIEALPRHLSGGQKQRVAIARSLAMNPKCLLFDEPTSALDPEMVGEVLDVMRTLSKTGLTMIIVTHEMQFAKEISSRTIFIDEGVIVEDRPGQELFLNPEKQRTKDFLKRFIHS